MQCLLTVSFSYLRLLQTSIIGIENMLIERLDIKIKQKRFRVNSILTLISEHEGERKKKSQPNVVTYLPLKPQMTLELPTYLVPMVAKVLPRVPR